MICQNCGVEAPTRRVNFLQLIGGVIAFVISQNGGLVCKSCAHHLYWTSTGVTAVLGWWSILSFLLTPIVIVLNTIMYIPVLFMSPVPPNAQRAELTDDAISRLYPYRQVIIEQMAAGEYFQTIAERVAALAGVRPGQVALFAEAFIQESDLESPSTGAVG